MNQPRNPEQPADSDQVDSDQIELGKDQDDAKSNPAKNPERAKQPKDETIGKDFNEPKPA